MALAFTCHPESQTAPNPGESATEGLAALTSAAARAELTWRPDAANGPGHAYHLPW